jgi:hypothetical protein
VKIENKFPGWKRSKIFKKMMDVLDPLCMDLKNVSAHKQK